LPPELANYYGETKLDGGKDDEMLMCKKAILCDDEFGGKSKQEAKKLKELSSKQYFSIRKPYGKVHEDLMRIAVLCGTTNDEEIINDPTGNRRIIPVNVLSIDWEKYKLIDKRLLWMELYHLWQSVGDGWMLTDSDIEVLNSATTSNQQPSVEKEAILEFFEMPGNGSLDSWWTNTKIKDFIETRSRMQISSYKLGANLKSMGFVKKNIKIGGISTACYNIAVKSNHRTSFDNQ
jgi:predicted P-loop ATPase